MKTIKQREINKIEMDYQATLPKMVIITEKFGKLRRWTHEHRALTIAVKLLLVTSLVLAFPNTAHMPLIIAGYAFISLILSKYKIEASMWTFIMIVELVYYAVMRSWFIM